VLAGVLTGCEILCLVCLSACAPKRLATKNPLGIVRHQEPIERVEEMERRPRPFRADRPEERLAARSLPVNTSLGDWQAVGPSNFGGKVYAVAVDPSNPGNVYAAYEVGGLWGTHNSGQSWTPMFDGFQDIAFSSVKTHPSVPGMVAAGLIAYGRGYFTSLNQHVGVVLSRDGGSTWRNIGPGTDTTVSVWELAFGDSTGQVIYAPTEKGLYKTTNEGQSWTNVLEYSGSDFFNDRPSFAVNPADSNTLLLAVRSLGVMRSTDAGKTWNRVDNWVNPASKSPNATILAWSSANSNYVYAEAYTSGDSNKLTMYLSKDAGVTWSSGASTTDFNQGMYDMAIGVDPFDANHVIIHNSDLQVSTDGLKTLQAGNTPGPDCLAVTFDSSTNGVVYSGGDDGVFQSTDGGSTWTRFDSGVLTNKSVGGSAYAVGSDGRIWTDPADYGGIRFTPGVGWTGAPSGWEYNRYYVNPHDPNDVYNLSATLTRVATPYADEAQIDPAPKESNNSTALDFDPVDHNTLYLGKEHLYKSTDRGKTWSKIGVAGSSGAFQVVRVAPSNVRRIYAVAGDTIWTTQDGGASWTQGATVNSTNMIAVSPSDEMAVYIASGGGFYKSSDGGLTATQVSGFPGVSVQWVTVDPNTPTTIYAALSNGGVLISQNAGVAWQQLGQQLPLVGPDWMTVMENKLYLGTGASVWMLNTKSGSACGGAEATPGTLMVPSTAGNYPVELFASATCSWQAAGPGWAAIDTFGTSSGHAILSISVTDNTAGSTRSGTIAVAGISIPITQLGGPNAVQDGGVVTLRNQSGCLTLGSDQVTLRASACNPANPAQQFNLKLAGGLSYSISNTGNCMDVYNDALRIGSQVAGYPCNYGGNEIFQMQPQTNGAWLLLGMDSGLCVSTSSTGSSLHTCSPTNSAELFTIASVSSASNSSVPLIRFVANAGTTTR
jgi:photosystem II stability/assembly factor-like uncharacterized protein